MQIEEGVICQSRRLKADNTIQDLHIFFVRDNHRIECSMMTRAIHSDKLIL